MELKDEGGNAVIQLNNLSFACSEAYTELSDLILVRRRRENTSGRFEVLLTVEMCKCELAHAEQIFGCEWFV